MNTFSAGIAAVVLALSAASSQTHNISASAYPDAATHLSQAIRIPTISFENGHARSELAFVKFRRFLAATYPTVYANISPKEFPGGALLYKWSGSDPKLKPLFLVAHQDVVPTDGQTWHHSPFSGEIAEGSVWGRGTLDDKGQLIGLIESIETLLKSGFQPRRTILVAFDADEELSGSGAEQITSYLRSNGVRAEYVLDEGLVGLDAFPLTGRLAAFIGVSEKGYATLKLVAHDKGGHAAAPPREPALERIAQAAIAVENLQVGSSLDPLSIELLRSISSDMSPMSKLAVNNLWLFGPIVHDRIMVEPAGAALLRTTFAPTMAEGSPKENVLPETASLTMNIRIHPRDRSADLLKLIRGAVTRYNVEANYSGEVREPSQISSYTSAPYLRLRQLVQNMVGPKVPVGPALVIGATDSRIYSAVADAAYRFQPIIITQADAETIHGSDEHISIANIERMVDFYTNLIQLEGR